MEGPECHFQNPEGINFCGACGSSLKEKKTGSEKKHVTIVFTDLSGYTAMTERLDTEEVANTLPYLATLLSIQVRSGFEHKVQFLDAETLKSQIYRAFFTPSMHSPNCHRCPINLRTWKNMSLDEKTAEG